MGDARRRVAGVLALVVGAVLSAAVPAGAQDAPLDPGPPVDLGAYGGPLRFVAPPGTTFEVPHLDQRYVDTLTASLAPDGDLVLVNELGIDAYVEGIAEMPARWPLEALKAQAVAARTYAWFEYDQGRWRDRGYDICRTTACQVFEGRDVVDTPVVGQRWAQAVAETAGEVLTTGGEPILARYFSTSGGRTRANEDVFTSEGPRPYLKPVDDPWDAVSPLHEWTVRFEREALDAILARGDQLSAVSPAADLELIPAGGGEPDRVRVTGREGGQVSVRASSFRAFVSDVAPDLFPDRYPSDRSDGRKLPATLPSSRFSFEVTDEQVIVHGRGWGHGVGMSQWGAMGRAEAGQDYEQILGAYYNGLTPAPAPGLPARIRVGLDANEGQTPFRIRADGPFRVLAGDTLVTGRGLGTWTVELRADRTIGLVAPAGYGAPLVTSPTESSRAQPTEIEVVTLQAVVNKPAELELRVADPAGQQVLRRPLGVVEAGRHRTTWSLEDADGRDVRPGVYTATLVARDEDAVEAGTATTVEVRALTPPGTRGASLLDAVPDVPAEVETSVLSVAAVLGLAAGAGLGAVVPLPSRRRKAAG